MCLACFCLVTCLSPFEIEEWWLQDELACFPSLQFSAAVCRYLVDFTSETTWDLRVLCEKVICNISDDKGLSVVLIILKNGLLISLHVVLCLISALLFSLSSCLLWVSLLFSYFSDVRTPIWSCLLSCVYIQYCKFLLGYTFAKILHTKILFCHKAFALSWFFVYIDGEFLVFILLSKKYNCFMKFLNFKNGKTSRGLISFLHLCKCFSLASLKGRRCEPDTGRGKEASSLCSRLWTARNPGIPAAERSRY